jgi:general secretion pathway protein D
MRLCDVPSEDGKPPDFDKLLGLTLTNAVGEARAIPGSATNAEANTLIGILTDQAFRQVIGKLEKQKGVDILSAPKITTLSGRQAQVKVVDIKSVVTLLQSNSTTITAGKTNLMSKPSLPWSPVTEPFELGPTVDVVPSVLAGGEHILLTVIPSVREFLGYDGVVGSDYEKQVSNEAVTKSRNAAHKATDELPESISAPLPRFRVRQALCKASVPDGQTLVIAGGSIVDEVINQGVPEVHPPKTKPKKGLLLFVTPRLIDANGNPLAR